MEHPTTPSSGNIFLDLGFDEAEAAHLEVRSSLMFTIRKLIQDQGLTQTRAAKLLGVSHPRIRALVRGRIDLFSIDSLVDMLANAGIKVAVQCLPRVERGAAIADLSEADIERLWLDEAERRDRAWDAGEVEGIPAEKVMRELRS